jgi:hypothetical protein
VPEDLTIGELGRRLDAAFADLKDDLRALTTRLDGKVDVQLLRLEQQAQDERHKALAEQVAAMRQDREADAKRLQDTRRWLLGVVVVPLLAVILPLLLTRGKL